MAMDIPVEDLGADRDIDVLWISNIKLVKRPDRLMSIARQLSDVNFTMIGGVNRGEEAYYAEMEKMASQMPNVRFLGKVPYTEVNRYVARSKVFLNTSDIEGFPNTFLQAWARKVPIVSFFDPDDIIAREGLGRRAATEQEMCVALRELLNERCVREQIGSAAHKFAMENYSPIVAAQTHLELL
jgi:glycosyltransferase involved in cell wall biosynthesis